MKKSSVAAILVLVLSLSLAGDGQDNPSIAAGQPRQEFEQLKKDNAEMKTGAGGSEKAAGGSGQQRRPGCRRTTTSN